MNPVTAFRSLQKELAQTYHLPPPVIFCIKGLSLMHWVWWLFRKRQMIKAENIVPAALGSSLDYGLKFAPSKLEQTVRGIAKLILIATRVDEALQRMQSLGRAFEHLKNAFTQKYSPVIEPQWIKKSNSIFISVRAMNRWKTFGKETKAYIERISFCLLRLFVKIFKLGMQMCDVYHALVFSHDAVPELFVNGMYWYRKVRHHKDYIVAKLEEYRLIIQKIFDATQTTASADDLLDKAKNVLDFTVKTTELSDHLKDSLVRNKQIAGLIKSKLLGKEMIRPTVHTPFVLKNKPDLHWDDTICFQR